MKKSERHRSKSLLCGKCGTVRLRNELFVLREKLDGLIDMCDTALALPRNIPSDRLRQKPCMGYIDVESLPILELSAEEERMLARAVAEKRFQSDAAPLQTVWERL